MKENEASATAFTVLQGILYIAQHTDYKNLVSKEMITAGRKILESSAEGRKRLRQLESRWFPSLTPLMERLLMPGITLHYVFRKKFIEEATLQAISEGVTQVVNLGAGFDTLAWRLHQKYPSVNFIEIDHPATNALKSKALLQETFSNLHSLSVDFSQQKLREMLSKFKQFDTTKKTLFICEGVLMYLQQQEVIQLLSDLKYLTETETQLVFTCVEPMNSSKNNTGTLLKLYLKFKGEPLNWTMEQTQLSNFLKEQQYQLQTLATSETFRTRYLNSTHQETLHQGEYVAVATIGENCAA